VQGEAVEMGSLFEDVDLAYRIGFAIHAQRFYFKRVETARPLCIRKWQIHSRVRRAPSRFKTPDNCVFPIFCLFDRRNDDVRRIHG